MIGIINPDQLSRSIYSFLVRPGMGTEERSTVAWSVLIDQTVESISFPFHEKRAGLRVPELKIAIMDPGHVTGKNPDLKHFSIQ